MSYPKCCTQMPLAAELEAPAAILSVKENPQNAQPVTPVGSKRARGLAPSLALHTDNKWANGRVLRVKILNGSPKIKQKIRQYANVWTQYANISFQFVDSGNAEIRVNVDASNKSWSYLGTQCLAIDQGDYTMNFGWLTDATDEMEFSRVITHEFGHALGCIHEHESPTATGIPWNRQAVYDYYARSYHWSRSEVDAQLFDFASANVTQFTVFDPNSIMLYPIPAELTTNGYSVGWNNELSNMDKAFIARVYPRP